MGKTPLEQQEMSKKPRPKKKYRPRAVAVPTYLNSLSSDVDHGKDARDEDRVFLLQVANRTVEKVDLAMYGQILQIAWVLAAKMDRAKELRQCLYSGLAAIGCYVAEKPKIPFDDEMFEELSQATEVARDSLFLSDEARVACAEQLSRLTDVQKRASYLFSYEDVADWIHENVESEVMSVLVPLSMFATDPDAFRAQFLEERGKRFVRLEDAITKGKSPARTPLSKWRVTRILPASVQSELGRWQEDYNAERERQGVAWPNPTSLTVDFPEGVLARYKAMKELAPTTARARATVLFEGFAVHREVGHTQPHCRRHYTPGLLLGKPIHWKDYELGLVDLMSIPRATALLGADYLRKAPWRLGKEDVAWCRDESVLHEVKLSREFRILLGIQRGPMNSPAGHEVDSG